MIFCYPRPLHNSNTAKVTFLKWSQKWIFVDGSAISSLPKYFENCVFNAILKYLGTYVNKNPFLRPLYNRYFCHYTMIEWFQTNQKFIKVHFLRYFFLIFSAFQCCARVSPGTQEPDPWKKIHQNRTRNCQKIKVSSRTGTGTAERCVSVLKPEKALKGQHQPHEINEFFWAVY